MGNIINIFHNYFYSKTSAIDIDDVKEPPPRRYPEYEVRPDETIDQYIERTNKYG